MVEILVMVPDLLVRWMVIEVARVIGWAVAGGVWMLAVERQWQERVGPALRVVLQLALWIGAARLAIWLSESTRFSVFR